MKNAISLIKHIYTSHLFSLTDYSYFSVCAQLYEHDRYNGWVENVGETENGQILHRNDMVSSVKVRPGCTLNAYRHINLEDHLFTATGDMNYVGHPNNDHMTSFTCSCGKLKLSEYFHYNANTFISFCHYKFSVKASKSFTSKFR